MSIYAERAESCMSFVRFLSQKYAAELRGPVVAPAKSREREYRPEYTAELRNRVVADLARGDKPHDVADRHNVSRATIYSWRSLGARGRLPAVSQVVWDAAKKEAA